MTKITDLTTKVTNGGTSERGRLSADEYNILLTTVQSHEESIASLEESTIKNCGYFSTLEALQQAYPKAGAGSKAYVGANHPYAIYLWDDSASAWVNSGATGGEENVKLEDYYTKEVADAKFDEIESKSRALVSLIYNNDAEQSNIRINGHEVIIMPNGFGVEVSTAVGYKEVYYIATTTGKTDPYVFNLNSQPSQSYLCIDLDKLINLEGRNEPSEVLVVLNKQLVNHNKYVPIVQNSPYVKSATFVGEAYNLWGEPQLIREMQHIQKSITHFELVYNLDKDKSNIKVEGNKIIVSPAGFGINIHSYNNEGLYYIATTTEQATDYEFSFNSSGFLCIDTTKLTNKNARNEISDVLEIVWIDDIDYERHIAIAFFHTYVGEVVLLGKFFDMWGVSQINETIESLNTNIANCGYVLIYNNDQQRKNVRIDNHLVTINPNGFGIRLNGKTYYIATTTGQTANYEYQMNELQNVQSFLCIDTTKLINENARNEISDVLVVLPSASTDTLRYIPIVYNASYTQGAVFIGHALSMWGVSQINETQPSLYDDLIPYVATLKKKTPYGYNRVNNPLVLLWFSDIHAEQENLQRITEWRNTYSAYIDDILNTGDTIYDNLSSYNEDMNPYFDNGGDKILLAIGNHDVTTPHSDNKSWDGTQNIVDMFNKYVGRIDAQGLNIILPNDASVKGYNFYYKDYQDYGINGQGIRLIVADSCITDNQYQLAQLEWIKGVLNDAKSKGYAVVIASHFLPIGCTKMPNAKGWAYETDRLNVSPSSVDERIILEVDDFINRGGHFVTWLCGHVHGDYLGVVPNHDNQLVIAITSSCRSVYAASSVMPVSIAGTKTQEAFNHIEVDTYNRQIKMLRIGYDIDALGREIKMITVDYQNKRVVL